MDVNVLVVRPGPVIGTYVVMYKYSVANFNVEVMD